VGGDKAVMDVPSIGPIFGTGAGILWKSYETFAQIRRGRGRAGARACRRRRRGVEAADGPRRAAWRPVPGTPVEPFCTSPDAPSPSPAPPISLRNQLLVATDWIRTKVFGRDISRF
jgi:hypothetical protein